ncbi:MAG: isochorismate synthase [Gemmatimonadetes bacterium]|nr:isochorismate synthase [Gemmatimonadota bacterium]
MPKSSVAKVLSPVEKRLVSLSVPLEDVNPAVLLRKGKGGPRGFWAREGRWFAHIGAAASIQITSGTHPEDRFGDVWSEARTIFSCSWKDPLSQVNPPSPRLFGGFSFDDDHQAEGGWEQFPPAHFVLPELEMVGGEVSGVLTLRRLHPPSPDPARCRQELREELAAVRDALAETNPGPGLLGQCVPATRSEVDRSAWGEMVERVLHEIFEGKLSKVTMARALTASFEGTMDPVDVVMNLWRENPGSHVFLFEPVPGHVLLGAAPETVATVAGGAFRATAVAGSISRGGSPEEQSALSAELLSSEKDRREHQVCVEDMVSRLAAVSDDIRAEPEPRVLTLAAIQHLETVITSNLHPEETVISALRALHPTPAVCGFPRDRALELLRTEEPFRRGWYAGPVGWFDNDGDGVFVPALRSALGFGGEWRLFAGAGSVAGSDPSKEWAETQIKFQPVLKALSGARAELEPGDGGES